MEVNGAEKIESAKAARAQISIDNAGPLFKDNFFDQTSHEREQTIETTGGTSCAGLSGLQCDLKLHYILLAFAVFLFSSMSWKLMIDVGKTDSAGWFCGNVIYKHEIDGRSYIYSIYKYAKREMGCDMSDNSDLKERVVDTVRRDFANNKIGSCVTILETERVVAYAKVLMPQFREITLNDLLCEAVKGWKVPN